MADLRIISHDIRFEQDVVTARRRAREIAGHLGFDPHDQTRIGTAVSEIVRNAFRYAGGGTVTFEVIDDVPQRLSITVSDRGPGIADPDFVLSGRYVSSTGMGMGIIGARRLMDDFELATGPGGTKVTMGKRLLPAHHVEGGDIAAIGEALQKGSGGGPLEEVQLQNHELIRAIGEIQSRQAEIERLNDELGETNRGVLALNAELEDRADSLRVASQAKSRFLSHISHEFRTPLNSIRNLARLLATHIDGPLTTEQERQVFYIRSSADALLEMVNELLDLAKIEAGKTEVQLSDISLAEMFGALRGMFRPLMTSDQVTLSFADATALPSMRTDETKLSQIVRNLISNAVKYTERGRIEVSAAIAPGDLVRVAVSDSGIGITAENLPRIFDEFVQITNPLQTRHKGTGLGLSLSMSLARMLGGDDRSGERAGIRLDLHRNPPARARRRQRPRHRDHGPSLRRRSRFPVIRRAGSDRRRFGSRSLHLARPPAAPLRGTGSDQRPGGAGVDRRVRPRRPLSRPQHARSERQRAAGPPARAPAAPPAQDRRAHLGDALRRPEGRSARPRRCRLPGQGLPRPRSHPHRDRRHARRRGMIAGAPPGRHCGLSCSGPSPSGRVAEGPGEGGSHPPSPAL
ncbi:MAG: signal transduction histidine kinase [Acidobacteria bacterium]|nr:signal transduction histidine kinase [Acidobacteriota bacterium]